MTNPYRSAEEFRKALSEAGSARKLARRHSVDRNGSLKKWANELGVNLAEEHSRRVDVGEVFASDDHSWLLVSLRDCGDSATVNEIADAADVSPRRVRDAMSALRDQGYRLPDIGEDRIVLDRVSPAPTDQQHPASLRLFDGDRIRFGIVSDTHLGSAECHLEDLHAAYDLMVEEGIETIYHPGDLVAGIGVYRHQHRDLAPYAHTFDEQVAFAKENYPKRDGITTYIISGNHDVEGEFGKLGADACLAVANQREDLVHCGVYSAWFEIENGAWIHMLHPMGGASYATSYKLQKMAESYAAGRKPSLLIAGHWHRTGFFWARNIALMHAGTFEGSTNLAVRLGLGEAHVGCWIVEATVAEDGTLTRIKPEWIPFQNGRRVG
jgi:predicted phosphodiesterase